MSVEALMAIDMTDDERYLLRCGLAEWGGPARCTEAIAVAMGFRSVADFDDSGRRLQAALIAAEPFNAQDWRRMLVATEIVFASDVLGAGTDWSITTGLSDEETIKTLRRLQRKLGRALYLASHSHDADQPGTPPTR